MAGPWEKYGGQDAPAEDVGLVENVGRAAAKGAVQALGFPAEVALAVPKVGAYLSGSEGGAYDYLMSLDPTGAIESLVNSAGINTQPDPNTFRERFASNTAEAVTGGAVGYGLGGMARGVATKTAERLLAGRLGRFAAEDAAAATVGAGVRSVAQEAGVDDPVAGLGEFAASFLTSSALDKARMAQQGFKALKDADIQQGFKNAEFKAAGDFLRAPLNELSQDPMKVAQDIKAPGMPGEELLTPGAKSGNTALIAVENSLIKSNPELQARFIESKKTLNQYVSDELKTALGGDGVPQDFIDNYRLSADYALQVTEKARQQAVEQAWKEINDLPPDADYSSPVKRILEEGKRADREIEREMWARAVVPTPDDPSAAFRGLGVTGSPESKALIESGDANRPFLKEAYSSLMEEIRAANRAADTIAMPDKNIMGAVKEIVEGGSASVSELLALRSSILDAAAEASANQNENLARRLNNLADGALNSLDSISGENGEAIAQARQFSKDLNDRYSRDVIGPILSRSASRGEVVPANETMERLFKTGESGRTNMRALILAAGEVPNDAKNYILRQFYQKAIGENGISVKDAEGFIRAYRPALEEAGLLDLASSYVLTGKAVNRADADLAELVAFQSKDPIAGVLKRYGDTGEDLSNYIGSVLKSQAKGAQAAFKDMYDSALTDLSGNALKGLKSATVDGVLKSFYTAGSDPDATKMLPDIIRRTQDALGATGQFTPEQIDRVRQLGVILNKQASAERLRAFKGQSNTPQDLAGASVLENVARMAALKYVAPAINAQGPGSMRMASIVSNIAGKWAGKLTENDAKSLIKAAIFDQQLFAALLENAQTVSPKSQSVITGFLKQAGKVGARMGYGGLTPSQTTILNEENEDGR